MSRGWSKFEPILTDGCVSVSFACFDSKPCRCCSRLQGSFQTWNLSHILIHTTGGSEDSKCRYILSKVTTNGLASPRVMMISVLARHKWRASDDEQLFSFRGGLPVPAWNNNFRFRGESCEQFCAIRKLGTYWMTLRNKRMTENGGSVNGPCSP
jgi:hypothetical protein